MCKQSIVNEKLYFNLFSSGCHKGLNAIVDSVKAWGVTHYESESVAGNIAAAATGQVGGRRKRGGRREVGVGGGVTATGRYIIPFLRQLQTISAFYASHYARMLLPLRKLKKKTLMFCSFLIVRMIFTTTVLKSLRTIWLYCA